jgi:uncharacterized protein RhaS with RHS repeats
MSDHIPAVYGLNRYLWAKIQEEAILDPASYGGLIPIIPTQEVPQLAQAMDSQDGIRSFPFIVYTWNTNGYDQEWYTASDQIIYVINSNDGKKLRQLVLLISKQFKRFDESARAVNEFVQGSTLSDEYKAYDYKYISVQAGTGGQPGFNENDPISAMVTVRAMYTHTADDEPL